ncbi:MAG: ABC transporter ATP-binding protein [Deltaproteobacteria bacterium]|nr:ABC transporter ATP-binding protein [Deltaproteobacteria bacterium]
MLNLKGVGISFGGLQAVKNVSFGMSRGQIKALIGPNGAGKTTLFNLITGMLRPDTGEILFQEKPLQGLPPFQIAAQGISRTFQIVQLFGHMTVLENVMVGRHVRTSAGLFSAALRLPSGRREEAAIRAQARYWLDFVGLASRADDYASNLPLGYQRLLEIARALATEPELLLLDEPAAGLGINETDKLMEIIFDIRTQGISVLLVEHDMSLTMEVADEIVVLDHGELLAEGAPREIQRNPEVIAAYLGRDWQQ